MDLGIAGKNAIVTGAGRGIGRAVVLELAQEGVNVIAASRSQETLSELEASLNGAPGRVVTLALDCSTREAPEQVMSVAEKELGGVDILVNNLGTGTFEHDWNTGDDEWERILNINLYSAVRFTRACVPGMKERGWGRIINMSSVSGHSGLPQMGDYNASKAGMIVWSKTLSLELGPEITVNSVCPAFIDTPLWENLATELTTRGVGDTVEEVYDAMTAANLVTGRYGRADEVSGVVAFLASERASFITGVAYNIDGGYTKFAF
jgi:NAD(P)-dependent dehydrogenase (short-subunit alcohol dehydrogenase family)